MGVQSPYLAKDGPGGLDSSVASSYCQNDTEKDGSLTPKTKHTHKWESKRAVVPKSGDEVHESSGSVFALAALTLTFLPLSVI